MNQGYGIAAVETIKALQDKGLYVAWNDNVPYCHINFIQPEFYEGNEYQYKIGYTPWESTAIPEFWPQYMGKMEEIWTTSTFCKEIFEAGGVQGNIEIVPHGIDPEVFKIVDRTLTNRFMFLHIGGPTERKGGKLVAKAFVELFDDRDDVFLIMKSHGPSEARWTNKGEYVGNIRLHPRVEVIEQNLTIDQMMELYGLAHCCVYPTNGEGFGLIPFQAIATGLPTITTNLTGTSDFAPLSMPLRATWGEGNGIHIGEWAIPDEDHLKELMLHAVDKWEDEKKKAVNSARILHNTQTWSHVADMIIDKLGNKLEMEVCPQ
jgi:glycosyltransferase involved in cell wall biosynthesis